MQARENIQASETLNNQIKGRRTFSKYRLDIKTRHSYIRGVSDE
jgi:hypothetical protein